MRTTDVTADDESNEFRHLGPYLKRERRARGMTLEALAADTDLSASYISQIENGRAVPSITALQMIAAELGVDLATLFPELPETRSRVVRASSRGTFQFESQAHTEYGLLAQGVTGAAFSVVYVRHVPGGGTVPLRHLGEEFVVVVSGQLRVTVRDEAHDLGPGEWLHYSSQQRHGTEVLGDEPVESLWILAPAVI